MEITRKNFAEQFDNISKNLKKSCFVGFDAEFTALLSGECFKHRLFDTNEEWYDKIKSEVGRMIMTQVGLTMFQYDREHDTYVATGYTFHLCPQAFGDVDQSFIFQASTLRFLCRHNFNFNKFTYDGIPYLSKAEEAQVRKHLADNMMFKNLTRMLEMEDEKLLQSHCSNISKWLSNNEEDTMYIDIESPVLRYVLHNEVRLRFPEVLTTDSLGNSNKVLIYKDKYVEGANNAPLAILEENLMSHLLGFSQIISLLEQYQKPIVGHNIFIDTVLLHNQFIGPLPKKYSTFKKNIHKMFPNMFDTKYISHVMAKKLSYDEVWKSNALQDLYEFFSEAKCKKLQNGVNLIKLSTPFDVQQTYHEAGWDSYCSGYCFVRLGHWAACENIGKFRPVGPSEALAALSAYSGKVNVIRGAILYMNLEGDDPPRQRPDWLHVRALKEPVLNVEKLASLLAGLGSVDVKPHDSRSALLAVASQYTADKILRHFRDSREYKISMYNVYRHSKRARVAVWSSAIITGSLVLYVLHKSVKG